MKYTVVTLDVYIPTETLDGLNPAMLKDVVWRGMEIGNLTNGSCVIVDCLSTLTCRETADCRCAVCRDHAKQAANTA